MSIGEWLLSPTGLTPHGFCLSWSPGLLALHAGSDAMTAIAYFSIPLAIISFTYQRRDLQYKWVGYLFISFILACGSTHLWAIITLWVPAYATEGLVKLITAILSVATAVFLWPLIPKLLAVPSAAHLETMNAELAASSREQVHTAELLRASEAELISTNLDLEVRVAARTADLITLNDRLERALVEKSAALNQVSEQEAILKSILDTGPDALLVVNDMGVVFRFSSSAERIFGWSSHEVVGRHVGLLMPEVYPDQFHGQPVRPELSLRGAPVIGESREVNGLRKDGTRFPMMIYVGQIQLDDGLHYTKFVRDLTHAREATDRARSLELQLNHIWSMNSLGEMAAVLAHELNQPLAAIANYTQGAKALILNMDVKDETLIEAVDKAANQAIRAGDIVRRMRNLIPSNDHGRTAEDQTTLVGEVDFMIDLVARDAGATILYDLAKEPGQVMADRTQIQQVILNLVRNAIEATALAKTRIVRVGSKISDGLWTVVIDDSGVGISGHVADHLFTPLMSTKAHGMGLGLSLSKTIIEHHGGRIWATESDLGGASFRFALPVVA